MLNLSQCIRAGRDVFQADQTCDQTLPRTQFGHTVKVKVERMGVDIAAMTNAGSATVRLLLLLRVPTTVSPFTSTALRCRPSCPSPASAVRELQGGQGRHRTWPRTPQPRRGNRPNLTGSTGHG